MGWFRRWSLRARLLVVSAATLVVGLTAGGVVLVATMHFALQRTATNEALGTADAVAELVGTGQLADPVPAAPSVRVQVVDGDGRVLSVSAGADRLVPILYPRELAEVEPREGTLIEGDRIGMTGWVRVVAVPAQSSSGRVTVLVARPTGDLTQSVDLLRTTLLVTFPPLVVVLAFVSYRVAGAALSPVEALRAGAEEITGGTRPGKLPVPDSRDEVHRLAVTLNGMLHRLDAARARQRAFVADAAHELRSPLANMRTELEVAQHLPDSTDWPELVGDLLTDVERLSRLVDDLLLLARADDGARPADEGRPSDDRSGPADDGARSSDGGAGSAAGLPGSADDATRSVDDPARKPREGTNRAGVGRSEEVELGQLVAAVSSRYPAVEYDRPALPLRVTGDRDELARVVANLLDNAVRHASSSVRLAVAAEGAYRKITVTDDGPGIPAADRDRVFDRFTRLDDARARDAGGSGLGLAIVRELVRRHHGTVTLKGTVPPPGLTVEVRIPAAALGST